MVQVIGSLQRDMNLSIMLEDSLPFSSIYVAPAANPRSHLQISDMVTGASISRVGISSASLSCLCRFSLSRDAQGDATSNAAGSLGYFRKKGFAPVKELQHRLSRVANNAMSC